MDRLVQLGIRGSFGEGYALWPRAVNGDVFHPAVSLESRAAPVFVYAGRLSPEKNLRAFLELALPGKVVIAGEGPSRRSLERRFRHADFVGVLSPQDLASLYRSSDVFVFPSKVDTFGIAAFEAIACGVPVAAFSGAAHTGLIEPGVTGCVDFDLQAAALRCLTLERSRVRLPPHMTSWESSTKAFVSSLVPVR
jgi:glycosyltransferase involved in cell wall biosynthesis